MPVLHLPMNIGSYAFTYERGSYFHNYQNPQKGLVPHVLDLMQLLKKKDPCLTINRLSK